MLSVALKLITCATRPPPVKKIDLEKGHLLHTTSTTSQNKPHLIPRHLDPTILDVQLPNKQLRTGARSNAHDDQAGLQFRLLPIFLNDNVCHLPPIPNSFKMEGGARPAKKYTL